MAVDSQHLSQGILVAPLRPVATSVLLFVYQESDLSWVLFLPLISIVVLFALAIQYLYLHFTGRCLVNGLSNHMNLVCVAVQC